MKHTNSKLQDALGKRRSPVAQRRGAALLEFALISFAFYLLFAGTVAMGRWIYTQQAAQDIARVAAREIALYPLPANFTFAQALADPGFRLAVYDPGQLVIDLDTNPPGAGLDAFVAGLPPVNRALVPLMITSRVDVDGAIRNLLHMPGLITDEPASPTGLTVVIPRIDERDDVTGSETAITLLPVLQEFGAGSFSLNSLDRGLVVLRLNVPFQSAALSAYVQRVPVGGGDPRSHPVLATDPAGGGATVLGAGPEGAGAYSGTYGLGTQYVLGQEVRPFRRLVAAQAIFRREVFL